MNDGLYVVREEAGFPPTPQIVSIIDSVAIDSVSGTVLLSRIPEFRQWCTSEISPPYPFPPRGIKREVY